MHLLYTCTYKIILKHLVQYWIDYTDIGEEGNWFTLSTGKNEFSNWSKGQPDNGGDQDCTTNNIGSLLGQWDDKSCHAKWPVLCEASGKVDVE